MGKSTFLLNLAVQVCQAGRRVLFITLEDSRRMQQQRLLSRFSGVPIIDIMRRRLCTNDQRAVFEATRYLQGMPLTFCDRRGLHSDDIRRIALSYQAEYGCDLVVVDHLGYIRGAPNEYERNSANIRAMADLAGELGTPLILAFQLNRELTRRDDKRPRLSDLRGTGTAEEDASAVWFVHRPHVFDPAESPNMFELIVAKCKWGPLATVELKCDLNCFRVGNIENEVY
jgi:replicative DNA helicase